MSELEASLRSPDKAYFKIKEYPTISIETQNGAHLDFCGIKHSNDPDGHVIERVRSELGGFLGRPSRHKKLVMLEGFKPNKEYPDSEAEAIRQSGEIALGIKLARDAGVDIVSPEPDPKEEFAKLCEEFPPNQVFYWIVVRQAEQWSRENPLPAWHKRAERQQRRDDVQVKFNDYVELLSEVLGELPSFPEVAESFTMINQTHQELFGGTFDWNKTGHFSDHTNPYKDDSVINKIMKRSNEIRDTHIADNIRQALTDGNDVFALYGDGHAYTLEPTLITFASVGRESDI